MKLSSGEDWTGLQVDRRWGDGAVKVESDEPSSLRGKKGGCLIPVEVLGCGEGSLACLAGSCGVGRPRAFNLSLKSRGDGAGGGLAEAAVTGACCWWETGTGADCSKDTRGERSLTVDERPLEDGGRTGVSMRGGGSRRLLERLGAEEYRERRLDWRVVRGSGAGGRRLSFQERRGDCSGEESSTEVSMVSAGWLD